MSQPSAPSIRVLVADQQRLAAEGLCGLLAPDFEIVGVATGGRELLRIAADEQPELIVADLSVLGAGDLTLAHELRARASASRLLVLSTETGPAAARAAFDSGARGYLLKSAEPDELRFALGHVSRGHRYLSPGVSQSLLDSGPHPAPEERVSASGRRIRVLIADDMPTSRLAIRAYLSEFDDLEVVGEAADGREAIAKAAELSPDVVVMDLRMPVLDGVGATEALLAAGGPQVVVLTGSGDARQVMEVVRAGALGYLTKDAAAEDVARAIRRAYRGEPSMPPPIARTLLEGEAAVVAQQQARLTERELEVVRLAAQGLSNHGIADRLCVSEATVRSHLRNVSEKIGGCNRVELVLHALRAGWASLDAAD